MATNTRKRYLTFEEAIEALDCEDVEIPSDSEDENFSEEDDEVDFVPEDEDGEDGDDDDDYNDDDNDDNDDDDDESDDDNNDDDECDDDTVDGEASCAEPTKKKRKKTERIWHWVKKDLPEHVNPENHLVPKGPALNAKSPLDMFIAHCGEDVFEMLTLESNRYRQQVGRSRSKIISVQEMRIFIGICFYMSVVSLPARRMYWSPKTRVAAVADLMPLNRFEQILSLLHANDNELMKKKGEQGYDRLHKVRPLIRSISSGFEDCAEPELVGAVDEQIVPFKGRHSLKVYMKKKPKKWGYKIWALGGKSGYVHKFYVAGDNTVRAQDADLVKAIGKSGEVVVNLTENLAQGSYVFFDNYFSSPELLAELSKRKIHATSTLRVDRTRKCPLMSRKELLKKGRGSYDFRLEKESGVLVCEWFDNKVVLMGSNTHGVKPTFEVQRYDRKEKKHINVKCPQLIKSYNECMGGVDKCDMLLALYRNRMKTRKWYKRILFHLLDLCVANSWLLYKVLVPHCTMQLVDFKLDVAQSLMLQRIAVESYVEPTHGAKFHSAKGVNESARYDLVDHFSIKPKDQKNGQRCKMSGCSRKSLFMCRKCKVYLCITAKDGDEDCFYAFHHRK